MPQEKPEYPLVETGTTLEEALEESLEMDRQGYKPPGGTRQTFRDDPNFKPPFVLEDDRD